MLANDTAFEAGRADHVGERGTLTVNVHTSEVIVARREAQLTLLRKR